MPQKVGRAGDKWASLTPVHLYIIHYRYIQPQLESWTLRSTVPSPMIIKQYSTKNILFFYLSETTSDNSCCVLSGLSLRGRGRGFTPATKNMAPGFFNREIEEKQNQKKSVVSLIPCLLVVFTRQLENLVTALFYTCTTLYSLTVLELQRTILTIFIPFLKPFSSPLIETVVGKYS